MILHIFISYHFHYLFSSIRKPWVSKCMCAMLSMFFSELKAYHLASGAQFSTTGVDFIQVALDGLQVGDTITTTQLQNQLQQGKGGNSREKTINK